MSHTYYQLHYHLVWSTKDRRPLIDPEFKLDLYRYLANGIKKEGGHLLEIGGVSDHVHLLTELSPQCSISDVVRNIKVSSCKWICENISKCPDFSWQKGYGAFAVSECNKGPIARYIQNQEEHHRMYSFKDEFLALLRKQNVQFKEEYLWK